LPARELVDVIIQKLHELMPDFKADLVNKLMQKQAGRDRGCLMAVLEPHDAAQIVDWSSKNIDPENFALSGIEHMPHVTIRYGFKPGFDPDRLKKVLADFGPVRLSLKSVDRFRGVEDGNTDCLLVKVESEDLKRLRSIVDEKFDKSLDTGKPFKPHLTLAYIQPGTCKKLDGHDVFSDNIYVIRSLVFSLPEAKEKMEIPLEK
jgi:2'-5' RNA ligase superfamily